MNLNRRKLRNNFNLIFILIPFDLVEVSDRKSLSFHVSYDYIRYNHEDSFRFTLQGNFRNLSVISERKEERRVKQGSDCFFCQVDRMSTFIGEYRLRKDFVYVSSMNEEASDPSFSCLT